MKETQITSDTSDPTKDDTFHKEILKWQKSVRPFLVGIPTLLIIVFLTLTTLQINTFNNAINLTISSTVAEEAILHNSSLKTDLNYAKWMILAAAEHESITKRYKQAGFLLMSHVLTKYIAFLTGMLLATVGAIFIVGKLSEKQSEISGSFSEQANIKLIASSPGIIFGVLGTLLMIVTLLTDPRATVTDQPMYLNAPTIMYINGLQEQNSQTNYTLDSNQIKKLNSFKNETLDSTQIEILNREKN